jgi:hypothetical protein
VAGLLSRPQSQRRWGGLVPLAASIGATGFGALWTATASTGGTVSYNAPSTAFPQANVESVIAAVPGDYEGFQDGVANWRRNGNSLYGEVTILLTSLTGNRFKFYVSSNADTTQIPTLQPTGDYAELVFDAATDASHWICQSAAAGTKNQVITSTTLSANTLYTIQMYFTGASDSNLNILVNGTSVCGTYTTDLPTATTFMRWGIGAETVAGSPTFNLFMSSIEVEGGSN